MAGLDDMWSRFSLTEEEELGADVPRQGSNVIHRLAGKYFTKRVVNAEAVARTFEPLWKLIGELKSGMWEGISYSLNLRMCWT